MSSSYRDLRVWQQAMGLAVEIYRLTEKFPRHELYRLTGQIRRAAISIPSNIAEGKGRRTDDQAGERAADNSRVLEKAIGFLLRKTAIAAPARFAFPAPAASHVRETENC